MKITITQIHTKLDKKIKDYAFEKFSNLTKYNPQITEIKIRLIGEKAHRGQDHDIYCEVELIMPGHILEIVDVERAYDKAIDRAHDRAKRSLVKTKEKLVSKKHKRAVSSKLAGRA